ncbi:hypothetical protein JFL47_04260 [Haemophilus haemoglobinophilus]|nr:hypothetical protein [Canicola haemoglobinophilus]
MKKILSIFSFILTALFLTGCMALSPDPKLHEVLSHNDKPLIQSNVTVTAKMNDRLARQDTAIGVSDLVRETIQVALKKANIFDSNSQKYYKIHAQITKASQAAFSMRRFPGKMEIEYTVSDNNGKTVFTKTVYNEGQSDVYYFAGAKRHTRSRIVTAAANVNEFITAFEQYLKSSQKSKKSVRK